MSHVAKVSCAIRDLSALEVALEKLGGELRRGQTSFKMYGSAKQPCVHAIALKGATKDTYEVGLRYKTAGDPETFEMACDFFDGKLSKAFGQNLDGLQNEYLATVAERQLSRRGYRVRRVESEARQIRLVATQ